MINKQERVKEIVQVGNSAGVILPREWLNGKARVVLVEEPLNIRKDIFDITEEYLNDIMGIYIVGSYGRGDETRESDVDVLVITNGINKKIKKGRYDVLLISDESLQKELKENIIPLLPMLKEAKPILNSNLIEEYKKVHLTKKNVKPILDLTKSSLKVNKELINLANRGNKLGDSLSYSLILGLRTLYILECLKRSKKWSTKELKRLIKNTTGSMEAYEGYLRVKAGKKEKRDLAPDEAQKLHDYLTEVIEKWDKWKGKRD